MHYFRRRMICLAKSRRPGGYCIAGKCTETGEWIRPIGHRERHEITEKQARYENGGVVKVSDIMEIPFVEKYPIGHQTENHLIHETERWKRIGRASWAQLLKLVDRCAGLWVNGYDGISRKNNRVPAALIEKSSGSLRLIGLQDAVLHVEPKAPGYDDNLKVRVSFCYQGDEYKLDLTDPVVEKFCLQKGAGEYAIRTEAVACISLGELFDDGFAYKLVASIITPRRIEE